MPLMYQALKNLADHLNKGGKLSDEEHAKVVRSIRWEQRAWLIVFGLAGVALWYVAITA